VPIKKPVQINKKDCLTTKTYSNPRLEISLKLPACYTINEPHPEYGTSTWLYVMDKTQNQSEETVFLVSSLNSNISDKKAASFEEVARYWKDYYLYSTSTGWVEDQPYVSKESKVTLNEREGIRYTIKFKKNNNTVYWTYIPWNEFGIIKVEYSTHHREAEQILSSIKYLKPAMTQVLLYFDNINKNPGKKQCNSVYAVKRMVPKYYGTNVILNELFKGPTKDEETKGFRSIFSSKTGHLSNGIALDDTKGRDNRVVSLDFEPESFAIVAKNGATTSCGGAEFISSIERTLKQFPEYEKYVDIQKSTVGGNRQIYCDYMQLSKDVCEN